VVKQFDLERRIWVKVSNEGTIGELNGKKVEKPQ
jgi:hypothetical protein